MTSLFLPAPVRAKASNKSSSRNDTTSNQQLAISSNSNPTNAAGDINNSIHIPQKAPSYEHRCNAAAEFSKLTPEERKSHKKKLFVPRSIGDFDDGGAFPEIHVAQYPKNMGNPHLNKRNNGAASGTGDLKDKRGGGGGNSNNQLVVGSSVSTTRAIANVQIDASGRKDYSSLIKGGTNADKTVYAHHRDLKGYNPSTEEVALPTSEEQKEAAAKTQAAIDALLNNKIAMSKPSGTALQNAATSKNQEENTQFIEYAANPSAPGFNPAAAKRVIQMVPAQLDPMMPPKHKHVKAPAGPAEDFVPVLHAPPEKLSKEEREAWNVPACISNWKNTKGFMIPLDKRLAADGRGLRDDTTINSNFATLSESLYLAERQAREEVRLRSLVQKRQAESERERRERELRELAMKARMDRSGVVPNANANAPLAPSTSMDDKVSDTRDGVGDYYQNAAHRSGGEDDSVIPSKPHAGKEDFDGENANIVDDDESRMDAEKRERIRQARRKERERELRMEKHKPSRGEDDEDVAVKKARLGDRDVSEKIALGVHTGGGAMGGVDGRLYNQNAGMDSGFGPEDEYNAYSKPMFDREGVTSSSIYRPSRGEGALDADEQYATLKEGATARFQPDKGFSGAEGGSGALANGPRNAPVQFEKEASKQDKK
jgi:SNW domain-containing protein 1